MSYESYSNYLLMSWADSSYSPLYSQCGDLFNSVKVLSRSLHRMHVPHAFMGKSAMVMNVGVGMMLESESSSSEIELVLSHKSYEHFLLSCVHQQMKPIEGAAHTFWDSRTGCTLRIHLVGQRIKLGRRSFEIPDLKTMQVSEEGIRFWTVESMAKETSRKRQESIQESMLTVASSKKPVAA